MAGVEELRRADVIWVGIDLADYVGGAATKEMPSTKIHRPDGSTVGIAAFADLMRDFSMRRSEGSWSGDRAASDRWLAPRLHSALRITRSVASDRALWHWLAVVLASDYVEWRWTGDKGITTDRWVGPIHKQAFARLWWGAELFRDGADYEPVERAFIRQDLPNSYLHRPLVRCRSFALGIVNNLTTSQGEALLASQVNDLARVLNLATAGTPPEAQVGFQQDDADAISVWAATDAAIPTSWDPLPLGPSAIDTTEASISAGKRLAGRGMSLAGLAADV